MITRNIHRITNHTINFHQDYGYNIGLSATLIKCLQVIHGSINFNRDDILSRIEKVKNLRKKMI